VVLALEATKRLTPIAPTNPRPSRIPFSVNKQVEHLPLFQGSEIMGGAAFAEQDAQISDRRNLGRIRSKDRDRNSPS
jgi:hypothetical protein